MPKTANMKLPKNDLQRLSEYAGKEKLSHLDLRELVKIFDRLDKHSLPQPVTDRLRDRADNLALNPHYGLSGAELCEAIDKARMREPSKHTGAGMPFPPKG